MCVTTWAACTSTEKKCILQAHRLIEANSCEASDVRISMCVMFAQTDEQKRFYVLDEDNNLPRPCMEYEAAAKKKWLAYFHGNLTSQLL